MIRKRGDKWEVRWSEPSGKRPSKTFDRKKDAEAWELEVRRRRQRGGLVALDAGAQTLAEFVEEWWRDYALVNLGERTRQTYAYVWDRHLRPRVGGYRLR